MFLSEILLNKPAMIQFQLVNIVFHSGIQLKDKAGFDFIRSIVMSYAKYKYLYLI